MDIGTVTGLMLPFIGTSAGAAGVFFMKNERSSSVQRSLTGFAAGVMTAASVWSLIIPAIERSAELGRLSFVPAFAGFWIGSVFLIVTDKVITHIRTSADDAGSLSGTAMMVLAVTLHNIPEGMAVGAVYAGLMSGASGITAGGALAFSAGIAIQNFPEGAIISMPLHALGKGRVRSFTGGVISGIAEPLAGVLTIAAAGIVVPMLPYLLSFAAGAMMYVVVVELIPEMTDGGRTCTGMIIFALGFSIMMAMDVALS